MNLVHLPESIMEPVHKDSSSPVAVSEFGKSIQDVLFNPCRPHMHMVHFREELMRVLDATYDLPLGSWMEGSSTFFEYGRTKYLFPSDQTLPPVIIMKSMEELEAAKRECNLFRLRIRPETVKRIKDALKKSKVGKKDQLKVPVQEASTVARMSAVDDVDIFGECVIASTTALPASAGSLFGKAEQNFELRSTIASDAQIKDLLLRKAALREPAVHRPVQENPVFQEDDFFPLASTTFGEKLDASKFYLDSSQTLSKKQKLGQEKQQFNEVMKRLAKDKR